MTGSPTTRERGRKLGGLLMWFAVLGGAVAWAVHLIITWAADEVTCQAGNDTIQGIPLRVVVGAGVVVPALIAAAALLMAWRAWRTTRAAAGEDDDPRLARASMLALVGVCADTLFLLIILAGGAAVVVLAPCQG
ncbi:hypothetical protein GCM10009682_23480 [Luedemannella flava]|uniref:Uncharacterized protein n=1 Tax=Luedemannella flava TaxID=349316 RepID=A0ABN2LW49_9ACTN